MRLHRLSLRNVRGVEARSVSFSPDGATTGVVIVEGCNEAGKSTLGDALDVLLHYRDASKHAEVRSLKTVDRDEPPEIEAELEVGDHRVVYTKRYLKRTSTELRILTPKAETLTGDAAHARMEQILNDQLDVGLWSSLRLRQGDGLAQAGPGGTQGLAAVLSAQGDAGAIGDQELAILGQVRQEYERYYTAKAGTPRPHLKAAGDRVGDLAARLADLDGRRKVLQDDVERADRLARSLPQLRTQLEQAARRASELSARRAEVEALASRVEGCERAVAAASSELQRLSERREHRSALASELAAVERQRAELAVALGDADEAQRQAEVRLQAARTQLQAAQGRQRQARRDREQARRHLDQLQDRAALAALRTRSERAAEALQRLRDAEAELDAITVDEALLEQLRDAQIEATRAQAALEAASPEVRFTAARDVQVGVGEAPDVGLDTGAMRRWSVHGSLSLRIGDVGELEVRAGSGTEDAAEAHRRVDERLRGLLEQAGCEDLRAAERALRRRRDAEQSAQDARSQREAALDGHSADELADELHRLERQVAGHVEEGTSLPTDLAAARSALAAASQAEHHVEDSVSAPDTAVEQARAEQDRRRETFVEQRTRAEEAARRVETLREELREARETISDAELSARAEAAADSLGQARGALEDARSELQEADPATVTTLADNAIEVADDARTRLGDAERDLVETRARITALGGDGLWEQREDVAAALAHAEAELDGLERRGAAARMLLETLEHHRGLARERYAAPLREQLLVYGRMLHGPEFDLELDDDLKVSRRHLDGVWLDVAQLSVGAQEQLALLGRLACATLLGDRGGLLLFDDALGNTDPERLELLGAVLRLAGAHCQVVVLTCYPDRYRHVGGATRVAL